MLLILLAASLLWFNDSNSVQAESTLRIEVYFEGEYGCLCRHDDRNSRNRAGLKGIAEDSGLIELNLHFNPGHFTGDSYYEDDESFEPWIAVRIEDKEGLSSEIDADLIAEVYGARIISYEYDEPIKNTFG